MLRRCFNSLGGDGEGEPDGEGCVIQLLSGSEGIVERGRIDVAIVEIVLEEYIEEDFVGERVMAGSDGCLVVAGVGESCLMGACSRGTAWNRVREARFDMGWS